MLSKDLFRPSRECRAKFKTIGGKVPVILIDGLYEKPDEVREAALRLDFEPPSYPYPGRLAEPPPSKSLDAVKSWALHLANREYLTRVPPISAGGRRITGFSRVKTDFAIVDVHPDDLSPPQRLPHIDPVPVFGLVYLNREPRGGTLFFEQVGDPTEKDPGDGYLVESNDDFELQGRICPAFNRLAIYPGFVPHSGDIAGDWIADERRFESPRLTQRFIFFP